jgi:hypothetical protein
MKHVLLTLSISVAVATASVLVLCSATVSAETVHAILIK